MANYSHQQNKPSNFNALSSSECIAWITLYGTEAAAIVTLNVLTIIVYLKERSLRKCSMYLVINLAVADMLVGGLTLVMGMLFLGTGLCDILEINFPPDEYSLRYLIYIASLVSWWFPVTSATNLAAISLERMHATLRPFKHRLIKKRIFWAAVAAVWFAAGLCITLLGLPDEMGVFLLLSFLSFCCFIIVVSYSCVAIKMYGGRRPRHHGAVNRERKLTKTLMIVTVISLLLTLPFAIFKFLEFRRRFKWYSPHLTWSLPFLFFANSLFNPILYAFRIPEFRRALLSFLGRRSQPASV